MHRQVAYLAGVADQVLHRWAGQEFRAVRAWWAVWRLLAGMQLMWCMAYEALRNRVGWAALGVAVSSLAEGTEARWCVAAPEHQRLWAAKAIPEPLRLQPMKAARAWQAACMLHGGARVSAMSVSHVLQARAVLEV
jgi:hypothetical protein